MGSTVGNTWNLSVGGPRQEDGLRGSFGGREGVGAVD